MSRELQSAISITREQKSSETAILTQLPPGQTTRVRSTQRRPCAAAREGSLEGLDLVRALLVRREALRAPTPSVRAVVAALGEAPVLAVPPPLLAAGAAGA